MLYFGWLELSRPFATFSHLFPRFLASCVCFELCLVNLIVSSNSDNDFLVAVSSD